MDVVESTQLFFFFSFLFYSIMASFKVMAMLLMLVLGVAMVKGEGEKVPRLIIQNRYSGCQPRVECPPYEDDVLYRLNEEYSVTWDTQPKKKQLNCYVECVGVPGKKVNFVGATRGTSTSKFEWRIMADGGYLRRFDAQSNVIQKFTRLWTW